VERFHFSPDRPGNADSLYLVKVCGLFPNCSKGGALSGIFNQGFPPRIAPVYRPVDSQKSLYNKGLNAFKIPRNLLNAIPATAP
jgi:hypothetical protein